MAEWVVTFWDVGQGEATDICLPDKSHILIDAGPMAGRQNPFPLWFRSEQEGSRPKIRALILTHTHRDHFGGALPLCEDPQQQIDSVIFPLDKNIRSIQDVAFPEEEDRSVFRKLMSVLRRRQDVRKIYLSSSEPWDVHTGDGLRLRIVRGPSQKSTTINGSGLIIRLDRIASPKVPLVVWSGDTLLGNVQQASPAGIEGVLTGPHHGKPQDAAPKEPEDVKSSYFREKCAALHPGNLFISVGTGNKYHHPYRPYLIGAAQTKITVCCSEVTAQCEALQICDAKKQKHVYPGSMKLGLQPPEGARQCRGTMRIFVSAADGVRPDEPCQSEFLKSVEELVPTRLCRRTLEYSQRKKI